MPYRYTSRVPCALGSDLDPHDHWRSGFYHIARGAGVPIVPAFLDYSTRQVGFGPSFLASGDVGADMDRLRAF